MPTLELVSRGLHHMTLAGERLDYVLVRRRGRRGVGLRVDENGLTVSAPISASLSKVEAAIREHERWVLRKVQEWSARRVPVMRWVEGASLPFLGGTLSLRLSQASRSHATKDGDELHIAVGDATDAEIRHAVVAWYRREAHIHLHERTQSLAVSAGIAPPKLIISPAMARWGSCNARREVRLAWRLVKAPPALVDYVVCHELAHLRHMDHSRAFWQEVERQCPDYRARRRELFATDYLYRSF